MRRSTACGEILLCERCFYAEEHRLRSDFAVWAVLLAEGLRVEERVASSTRKKRRGYTGGEKNCAEHP